MPIRIPQARATAQLPSTLGQVAEPASNIGADIAGLGGQVFDTVTSLQQQREERLRNNITLNKTVEIKNQLRKDLLDTKAIKSGEAIGITESETQRLQSPNNINTILQGIEDQEARSAVQQLYINEVDKHLNQVATHEARQQDVYNTETKDNWRSSFIIETADTPVGDINSLFTSISEYEGLSKNSGLFTDEEITDTIDSAVLNTVKEWAWKDPILTEQLLEENKDQLEGVLKENFDDVKSAIRQGKKRAETDAKNAAAKAQEEIKKQQEVTRNDLLGQTRDGVLTSDKIRNSDLPAFGTGSKKSFFDIIDRQAKQAEEEAEGAKKFESDTDVYNSLVRQAHNGEIEDPNVPIDMIGLSLTTTDAEHIKSVIIKSQEEDTKVIARAIDDGQGVILKGNILTGQSTADKISARSFEIELSRLVEQGIGEGKSVEDMLTNTGSKDYLYGKVLNRYITTPQAALQNQVEELKGSPLDTSIPQRKANESINDYLLRTSNANQ